MYEKLGMDIDKGYQPIVKSSSGEDMGVLGQVTFTFKINDTLFTQSFVVCRHMTRHMILGTDFTATNFVGVIWTRKGTQKLLHFNGETIIELPDSASGVPLVLSYSVKIHPGDHFTVPLECTRLVTDRMDIRMDIGFHHRNLNVYIPHSFVNNPNNKYNPKYIPLTIFNLSKVDHLYIGRDTVIAFTNVPEFDVCKRFEELCEEYGQAFSKHNEDIGRTKLVKMDVDTGDSPPVSSRPYTLPLKHYEWVQKNRIF